MALAALLAAAAPAFVPGPKGRRETWPRRFVSGLIATTLVPVLLSSINSDLLENAAKNPWKWTVFLGYCVLAALVPKPFTDRMLRMLDEKVSAAEGKTDQASRIARGLLELETAPTEAPRELSVEDRVFLEAMAEAPFRWVSADQVLAAVPLLDPGHVRARLRSLETRRLVVEVQLSEGVSLWGVSPLGRVSLEQERNEAT